MIGCVDNQLGNPNNLHSRSMRIRVFEKHQEKTTYIYIYILGDIWTLSKHNMQNMLGRVSNMHIEMHFLRFPSKMEVQTICINAYC